MLTFFGGHNLLTLTSDGKCSRFWPYLIVTVLVVLVYLPTFSGGFILDDRPFIENNTYIRTFHSPLSFFGQEDGITDKFNTGDYHTGYYRPLINLTYSIDYKLWGLSAPGFRATNLFLHIICCFVLFHFLQFLINDRYAALWATLIFAIHSVNTETVSWIVSRNNILVTIFSISSLFLYIKGWEEGGRLSWMASVLTFALAILSKEMGLMMVPIFFLYQRLLSRTRRNIYKQLLSYLPFIIVMVGYFVLRKGVTASYFSPSEMAGFWNRVCFAPYVILWNLRLIFLPYGLHSFVVDYPATCLSWQFLAGLCYTGFLGIFIWKQRKNRLMIFSVLSFHVALFPTLNIVPTSAVTLVSMRWLYFSMAFLSSAYVQAIRDLLKVSRFMALGILCSILVYLGSYSYILNSSLWHNEDNFFRQEVLGFRNYYYAGGLAGNLLNKKEYQEAEEFFQLSIQHYPRGALNYINYSFLLMNTGRPDVALAYLKKAEALFMTRNRRGQWFNYIGMAHFQLKNHKESLKYFTKAVKCCPSNIEYCTNLGCAYTANGNYAKGASVLEKTLEIAPNSAAIRKNLALTYIQMKRYSDAMTVLQDIPKKEWEKYGVKELLQKARTSLLQSHRKSGEIQG